MNYMQAAKLADLLRETTRPEDRAPVSVETVLALCDEVARLRRLLEGASDVFELVGLGTAPADERTDG